jgi:hypothetical protein
MESIDGQDKAWDSLAMTSFATDWNNEQDAVYDTWPLGVKASFSYGRTSRATRRSVVMKIRYKRFCLRTHGFSATGYPRMVSISRPDAADREGCLSDDRQVTPNGSARPARGISEWPAVGLTAYCSVLLTSAAAQ